MIQDREGFMWFGTDVGLLRYDGYEFKEYATNPYDSTGYNGGRIDRLIEDHKGNLWFSGMNDRGLYRFDPATEQFTHYEYHPEDSGSINTNSVTGIFEDSQNRLWIGTRTGLNLYYPDTESFMQFVHNSDTSGYGNAVVEIFEYQQDEFWLSVSTGLLKFNARTYSFEDWPEKFENFPQDGYWRFYRDYSGQIWATAPKLHKYDSISKRFIPVHFTNTTEDVYTYGITGDKHGQLFTKADVPGNSGIAIIDTRTDQIHQFFPKLDDPYSLKDGGLNLNLFIDRSGILWTNYMASSGSGSTVTLYNPNKVIRHYVDYLPIRNRTNDLVIPSIHIDDSTNVWIGTQTSALIKYNPINKTSSQYLFDPEREGILNAINAIFQDKFGILWVGGWNSGIYKLEPATGKWKNYKNEFEKHGLAVDGIGKIYEDSNGYLWIGHLGSFTGIVLNRLKLNSASGFDREFVTYDYFRYSLDGKRTISDFRVSAINEDSYDNLWIGTAKGLNKYVPVTNDFDVFLPQKGIISLFTDRSGNLWVGTLSGLFKANRENLIDNVTFKRIDIVENLVGRWAGIFHEDKQGNLWGAIDNKILRFNPTTGSYKIYDEGDGVLIKEISGVSVSNGLVAIGGTNGFVVLHPDSLKENSFIPPVVFTDFQISNLSVTLKDNLDGKPILTKVINHTEKITLPYGQNFSFKYAALNFTNTPKNLYSYQLEGFDEEWSPASTTRTATFTNLWEGDYTFRVKGSNNDGVWNEEGASLQITILPPIWRSWWAYSVYALVFLSVLTGGFRFFIVRERLQGDLKLEHLELEKAQEMDQMKTQFFTNVSHEFRTPLTLILGPLKQMYEGTFKGDVHTVIGVMIRNSKRLLQLINQLLDFSKLDSGAVTLQVSEGDLVEFVRTMFSTFESTAQSREIRYIFQSNVSSLPTYFERDKLEKVIINLLSNAFKFTRNEGSIELTISKDIKNPEVDKGEGLIEIRIEDNGSGIDADKLPHIFERFYQADPSSTRQQEGTGIGLALAKELVELHYGSIRATSKKGEGTAFIIHLPLGRSHLNDTEVVIRTGYQPIDTTAVEALPDGSTLPLKGENENGALPLVLIIDDNKDMRLYLMEVLSEDYRLAEASNGQEGLEYALEHMPDLILSDVMMPEMDGYELCQKLKTNEHTSHIPVVLLTARAGDEAKLEGLETGADDYVTKPFSAVELKARVQNLIELRQKLRERYSSDISLLPKDIAITSVDERFLQRALDIVEIHRSETDFNAEDYAKEIGMSRSQLHRKLGALTGQTTSEFIRCYRLNYARQLIEKDFGNMAQVTYECGFTSPSYFTVCFKKQFGKLPSEYAKDVL